MIDALPWFVYAFFSPCRGLGLAYEWHIWAGTALHKPMRTRFVVRGLFDGSFEHRQERNEPNS